MRNLQKIWEIALHSDSYSEYMMKMNLNGFSKAKAHGLLKVQRHNRHIQTLIKDGVRSRDISLRFILNCL